MWNTLGSNEVAILSGKGSCTNWQMTFAQSNNKKDKALRANMVPTYKQGFH